MNSIELFLFKSEVEKTLNEYGLRVFFRDKSDCFDVKGGPIDDRCASDGCYRIFYRAFASSIETWKVAKYIRHHTLPHISLMIYRNSLNNKLAQESIKKIPANSDNGMFFEGLRISGVLKVYDSQEFAERYIRRMS